MADKIKLEIRTAIKKRKPTYRRRQSNQFAKLAKNDVWRRPKGMGNKSRRNRRGHIGMLKVGYGSPKEVRGANRDGLFEVVIANIAQLQLVNLKTQVPIISTTVGNKKKLEILEFALKEKISIGNVKDISAKIEEIKSKKKSEGSKDTKKKLDTKKVTKDSKKDSNKEAAKESKDESNKEKSDKFSDKKTNEAVEKKDEQKASSTATPAPSTSVSSSGNKKVTTTTTTTTKTASVKATSSSSQTKEVSKK
ncbi:MAG: eL32 family ribosomal protein [Candidatus Woesearchaeota archaeon]